MPDQKDKLVLDEQTLGRLLEAAFVLQEHNRELKNLELNLQQHNDQLRKKAGEAAAAAAPIPEEEVASQEDFTPILVQIVEAQRDIRVGHLAMEETMALVTERVAEISKAQGAAIGILDGKNVHYRASSGKLALTAGSQVPMEKALCFACLRTGQLIRCADVDPEFLLDAEECHRRSIQSLIVVPVYHDGGIAGALELYFARSRGFTEQNVHTCQLMAGLVTEALARDAEGPLKSAERTATREAREKLKPNLALSAGRGTETSSGAERPSPNTVAPASVFLCRKCGHELLEEEQFCGKCGLPRSSGGEQKSMQSKLASLWHMQQATRKETPARSNGSLHHAESRDSLADPRHSVEEQEDQRAEDDCLDSFVMPQFKIEKESGIHAAANGEAAEASEETTDQFAEEPRPDDHELEISMAETSLIKAGNDLPWSSAANARDFLEQLAASRSRSALAGFWNARRGDIYLAVAVILIAGVIRWEFGSNHAVGASGRAPSAIHRKQAPDADLSLFDKVLIGLGLAEAPEAPEYKGNPQTEVWVDLHTALYYCPGTDLYGKTPRGKFTTQRDAQLDQFEPAYRKACD